MKEMQRSRKSTDTCQRKAAAGRARRTFVTRRPGTMQLNNAVPMELGTDFGFYPNLGSIFDADFKISG